MVTPHGIFSQYNFTKYISENLRLPAIFIIKTRFSDAFFQLSFTHRAFFKQLYHRLIHEMH